MRLFFTAAGYGQYLHRFSCVYRENVPGSAFQVWTRESAAQTARRAATVTEMLRDVDAYAQRRYSDELKPLIDRYLYVELWNTDAKRPFDNPALKARYKALPFKQKLIYRAKRLAPRRIVDAAKRLIKS